MPEIACDAQRRIDFTREGIEVTEERVVHRHAYVRAQHARAIAFGCGALQDFFVRGKAFADRRKINERANRGIEHAEKDVVVSQRPRTSDRFARHCNWHLEVLVRLQRCCKARSNSTRDSRIAIAKQCARLFEQRNEPAIDDGRAKLGAHQQNGLGERNGVTVLARSNQHAIARSAAVRVTTRSHSDASIAQPIFLREKRDNLCGREALVDRTCAIVRAVFFQASNRCASKSKRAFSPPQCCGFHRMTRSLYRYLDGVTLKRILGEGMKPHALLGAK
jgi:hypothetical protein